MGQGIALAILLALVTLAVGRWVVAYTRTLRRRRVIREAERKAWEDDKEAEQLRVVDSFLQERPEGPVKLREQPEQRRL